MDRTYSIKSKYCLGHLRYSTSGTTIKNGLLKRTELLPIRGFDYKDKTTDEVCNEIGANSLKYLDIDDLEHFPENSYNQCFTGFIDPEIKPR